MAKIYPPGTDKTSGTEQGGPVRKTFGVYSRPAKVSRGVMIAFVIAAVLFLIIVAAMLLR